MLKNYFKIAIRHLFKNRLYSFVNIVGLTVGITSCVLIGVYIQHELSFDKFHVNANHIARVTMDYNSGDAQNKVALTGTKVGPQFKRTFPQVETYSRTLKFTRVLKYQDKLFEEKNFFYADSAFFCMFSFPLVAGNAATALDAPDKIVLTQSSAKKYFGTQDPMGKIIRVGDTKDFIVTGVAKDAPHNSQIKFDFVGSFTSLNASKEEKWWEANYITFLLLKKPTDIKPLQQQVYSYMKDVSINELKMEGSNSLTYHLEPLTSVHLYSALDGFEPNTNIVYIYVLGVVAILILLVACVNYTNLSTAQSASRGAEIGIRKVLGARKTQLFNQFISESVFFTFVAAVFAILASYVLLPFFNQLSGKALTGTDLFKPLTLVSIFILVVLVALMSGAYPAIILSNVKLIKVLKSGFSFSSSGGRLRKSLIVFQFVISLFLITSTIVILKQLSFIKSTNLGYDKEHVVVLPLDSKLSNYDDLKRAITSVPNVISAGAAYETPADIGWSDGLRKAGEDEGITVNALPVDESFIKTMDVKIIAGSDYTQADVQAFDTTADGKNLKYTYMLNESAVKALGWTPEEAIGKSVAKGRDGVVKAVVKDFHFRSFHEPINPLVIFLDKRMVQVLLVKINKNNVKSTLDQLQAIWKERVTHRPFEYRFLDDDYDAMYKTEQRTAGVFTTFSTLAISLACLGLFALSAFELVKRTKEIGIRKVLGASVSSIVGLVAKGFLKLIAVAMVIAFPIAWFVTNKWLQDFTYRVSIGWWMFAVAAIIVVLIAIVTISFQAIKAAIANPIKSLRTE